LNDWRSTQINKCSRSKSILGGKLLVGSGWWMKVKSAGFAETSLKIAAVIVQFLVMIAL
jgi:hypothetical protein